MSLVKMITAHSRTICSICWCPHDSNKFVSCAVNGDAVIWNVTEGKDMKKFSFAPDVPEFLDWAPQMRGMSDPQMANSSLIAVGTDKGDVRIWEVEGNTERK